MARRRRAVRREVSADSLYESVLVERLINTIMERGKKATASRIVYGAVDISNEGHSEDNPIEILNKAIDNIRPRIEVKSRRVGGATYQVPMEVPEDRQIALALRWMVDSARKRKGVSMMKSLAQEIKDGASNQGNAVRKRDDVHRMAQANRAFAHLRW